LSRWTRVCGCPRKKPPPQALSRHLTRRSEKKEGDYLKTLSELGHFLKGSSATLGLTKVKDSCEKIQRYGSLEDEAGAKNITEDEACEKLEAIIAQAKTEFTEVKEILKEFYNDPDA
jgi:osomolarity two-component system phosphorelay intermediate protein YPD1